MALTDGWQEGEVLWRGGKREERNRERRERSRVKKIRRVGK